jgi:RNA polymerase sigma-70 factor (ECF subfamily)
MIRGYAVAEERSQGSSTDAELVERVRGGDERAFEQLVRRHLGMAHSLACSKLSGDSDDADDVCQEAFLTALERIEDCRNPERFGAWLASIVRNKAHNYRSYLAVRRGTPLESVETARSADDASERVERHEIEAGIREAMSHLTELQRSVFVRFDLEGWSHGEIAEDLGISAGASRFHLHAARRSLRDRLTAYPLSWSR